MTQYKKIIGKTIIVEKALRHIAKHLSTSLLALYYI
jgi:hypothetical protein